MNFAVTVTLLSTRKLNHLPVGEEYLHPLYYLSLFLYQVFHIPYALSIVFPPVFNVGLFVNRGRYHDKFYFLFFAYRSCREKLSAVPVRFSMLNN